MTTWQSKKEIHMRSDHRRAQSEAGQALVLLVGAMVAVLAMAGLIVDGGNAWAQQRDTQNGTDAAAEAGAVVIVQKFAGVATPTCGAWDCAVADAVAAAASNNEIAVPTAYYTDVAGQYLTPAGAITSNIANAAVVGAGTFPPNASGVLAQGEKPFATYIASIVGQSNWTARAEATAVAGTATESCKSTDGCALVPVTFPVTVSNCAGNGKVLIGDAPFYEVGMDVATGPDRMNYLSILPLCKDPSPGSVGWLDFGCDNQLFPQIYPGCPDLSFDIPTWIHTNTGNTNDIKVQNAMDHWVGSVIKIPLFDGTCKTLPPNTSIGDCPDGEWSGVGNNSYYHIPAFADFLLYEAHIHGSDAECHQAPGAPLAGGNGGTGCLKGWFIKYVTIGPVGAFDPNDPGLKPLGVQLIH